VLWFTGLSGSGKTTIARAVEAALFERGCRTMLLDGDTLRHGLCGDLGFSAEDRAENIRRAGEVARLFFEQGSIVLCTFVSPFRGDRDRVRELFPDGRFLEIHVDCDLDTLSPYEKPLTPELALDTAELPVERSVEIVLQRIGRSGILASP
jgi:bifunctional enzyme CysN/CysC